MLTSLRIKNFKAWKDTGEIRLAPLTVIFGANSAGKSSLGQFLLALKQTALSTDRRRALHLGDAHSLIDLGTFKDCIYDHDLDQPLSFHLSWRLPKGLMIQDPIQNRDYLGDELTIDVSWLAGKTDQPEVIDLKFILKNDADQVLKIDFKRKDEGYILIVEPYFFIRNTGSVWTLDEPEKFYRISERTSSWIQNAAFLSDFALETERMLGNFYYLEPLRKKPERIYPWSGNMPEEVGLDGGNTIAAILAAQEQNRMISRGPNELQPMKFTEFIASWLKDLGIIHEFSVKPLAEGRKEYEVLVQTHPGAAMVKITDVGFGVSQVLPAIVEAFYCPPWSAVWMEQPEIHLHPQVQAELADVFISAVQARENGQERNVQLIIESHSEHFLNRLQRRIAEGSIRHEEVAIYFCKRTGKNAELELLRVNPYGEIENWPENFFGDEMADLAARTEAATKRRQQELPQ